MRRIAAFPPVRSMSGGFTLLEMLVVLAITGLIAGLMYPQLQTASFAIQQRHAREQVAAGAEGARALAIRSGGTAMLTAMNGGAGLVISSAAGDWRRLSFGAPANGGADAAGTPRLALRPQRILFYSDGSTSGGQLQLTSPAGTITYVIDRNAGRFRKAGTGGI
jgi:general secretion pathway protein H